MKKLYLVLFVFCFKINLNSQSIYNQNFKFKLNDSITFQITFEKLFQFSILKKIYYLEKTKNNFINNDSKSSYKVPNSILIDKPMIKSNLIFIENGKMIYKDNVLLDTIQRDPSLADCGQDLGIINILCKGYYIIKKDTVILFFNNYKAKFLITNKGLVVLSFFNMFNNNIFFDENYSNNNKIEQFLDKKLEYEDSILEKFKFQDQDENFFIEILNNNKFKFYFLNKNNIFIEGTWKKDSNDYLLFNKKIKKTMKIIKMNDRYTTKDFIFLNNHNIIKIL